MVSSGISVSSWSSLDTCREGDAPAPVRAHRGTTSLAALLLALPLAFALWLCLGFGGRSLAGCDGPDPPGSTWAVCLFFRGLTGDGRVVALRCSVYGLV